MAHDGNIITFKATPFHFSMDLVRNFFSEVPLSRLRGFLGSSVGKESACNAGDLSSITGWRRSAGEGIGYALQYPWASLVAQLVKNPPGMWESGFNPWVVKIPQRRERLSTPVFWPGEFHGLHGVAKSRSRLSDFHSLTSLSRSHILSEVLINVHPFPWNISSARKTGLMWANQSCHHFHQPLTCPHRHECRTSVNFCPFHQT